MGVADRAVTSSNRTFKTAQSTVQAPVAKTLRMMRKAEEPSSPGQAGSNALRKQLSSTAPGYHNWGVLPNTSVSQV